MAGRTTGSGSDGNHLLLARRAPSGRCLGLFLREGVVGREHTLLTKKRSIVKPLPAMVVFVPCGSIAPGPPPTKNDFYVGFFHTV